jgi:hypothetical protein
MQFTRSADDVVDRVARAQARPQEHSPDVHVDRDVAPTHLVERDGKVARKDLDCHGRLLLADAVEGLKPGLKGPSGRPVCPEAPHIAIELPGHATRRPHDPTRPDGREPMGHRPDLHSPEDARLITGHSCGIEVTKALM